MPMGTMRRDSHRPGFRAGLSAALLVPLAPALAQTPAAPLPSSVPPGQPQGSLIADPQQGATPRPLPPGPPVQAAPVPAPVPSGSPLSPAPAPRPLQIGPGIAPFAPATPRGTLPPGPGETALPRQAQAGGLPVPSGDPLRIDADADPILRLARTQTATDTFARAIQAAVTRNPSLDEASAQVEEAREVRSEARARTLPTADLSISTFQVIDRAFSNDPGNVLERSRPSARTDGLLRVQQPVVDFGASGARIRAAQARLTGAQASVEDTATRLALQAVSAWYNVYGYRTLVRLSEAFGNSQREIRRGVEARISQGAAATGDIAQVDSYIASSAAQLADFRRQLASAEAQYAAVVGEPAPADLARAPVPALGGITAATLPGETDRLPLVRAARQGVQAARADVRALQGDRLPQLSAGIDAGRYGIIETARDYDVRGSLTLSMRIGGGIDQRIGQARARAGGAEARLRRTLIEVRRDAEIALADVAALSDAQEAIRENYLASRRSRDVLAERFRVSRGTLFDLLAADNNYFGVAARFIQTTIELDTARYALLARTGRLLSALDIQPAALEPR
ncbi:TolC family protein [Sphingomonas yantingensis]|uniref:Adhesin transport system outer membrane protein n=1 Tax=Sphingomonas yantingensis TaxID=1241761 RepID=A0A7W9AT69_9SPHN|nr:TolC family protein [Sphingomonas yantingensis]MBB5700128.1 adhesin transport system outer membrane protein [Sphingomonas yantingensis]